MPNLQYKPSHLPEQDARSLADAFGVFNELSERLTGAYAQLEQRVAILNQDLERSRRQRLQERAQKEHLADQLGVLLEALPAGVVLVDVRERIDRFNPAAEQLFPDIAWGRRWPEVVAESVRSETTPGEWRLVGERYVNVLQRPLSDRGRILVLVDVTDQRRLNQTLERQGRLSAMGEMAAQLAHQIRTPLSTALLYAGQLGSETLNPAQRTQFAAKLLDGLRHTESLIGEMLAFSRGGSFRAARLDILDALSTALAALQPRIEKLAACVDLDLGDLPGYHVAGNRDALAGAFGNLIDNALDHGGRGSRVAIRATRETGGNLLLRFEDAGPGIDTTILGRIFDPFFTTRERGTGLGLAVVQAVVLEHGGQIDAGNAPRGGARFDIRLPPAAAPFESTVSRDKEPS